MAIALFLQAIQALTGSQFVKDRLQRSEHVIRVLKAVGLDPEHSPADFEAVYAYAIVEYGYGKPDVCLEIFRAGEIRSGLRRSFDENDPQGWLAIGEAFLASSEIGERVRSAGCNPRAELAEFAAAFLKVTRRSQTPKETLVQHQLRKIERTIDRKLEQVAGQLEAIGKSAALSPVETLALASANCRAAGLADQMRSWFEVLGYRLEKSETWELDYFEWVIEIPKRRGFDRVLVRGIVGEVGVKDVMALRESVGASRVDEGWVVTARRISKAARSIVEQPENADLFCFTFDEFLDQDADFEGYATWLMGDIETRGIEARYVPLACTKEEFDSVTHQRLGMSRYGESDGWTEGYIDLWLDDPAKEHLSILGEFGTGKTWLTLHYATIALRKYQVAKAAGIERPRLPIVIPLRDYAKAVSVESLFSEFFFRKHEIPIPGYSAFEELNRMGKLLLIFDGFDEMAARVDKQQMINNFWELAKVVVPGSKVILTCRTEHFPDAKEGRLLLNAELQASTRGLSGETPQFEVLELEKFEDSQIRSVLLLASSSETVEQVMGNPQLLDLARRPVMTELILEALPDIEAGKPVDMSRVYLYAVRRKMERDIRAERTFTSMADKLYFLCELSWEMLSNDKMSINYREFPDRIRTLFSSAVQEEKDLDHWHYDMMGQTMLIRNSDGDYTPAHRSLLEFFVAFKFAAELGALAPDFLELAQMKSGIDRTLEPREYTWSEYFGGGAVAPLKGFVTESLEKLRSGFGKEVLSKAILDLLTPMIQPYIDALMDISLAQTQSINDEINYIGGNIITLLLLQNKTSLIGRDFSNRIIQGGDFSGANLRDTKFINSRLEKSIFTKFLGSTISVSLSSNGEMLVTGDYHGSVRLWNALTGEEKFVLDGHLNFVSSVAFSPDDKVVASASHDGSIILWNTVNGEQLGRLVGHEGRICSVTFSNDGKFIASGGNDTNIRIWNSNSGDYSTCLKIFSGHTDRVNSVAISPDSKTLVSASADGVIKLWNIDEIDSYKSLVGHDERVFSVAFSTDGKFVVSGGSDQTLRLWDVKSGVCLRIIEAHTSRVNSVAFSPNGRFFASASHDKTVRVWEIETGNLIHLLSEHSDHVYSISFSKDGNLLASSSRNQSVKVWDTDSGECLRTLQGHTALVRTSFSRDGNFIAIGDNYCLLKIWNCSLKRIISVLERHSSWIGSVAFSKNEKILASGGGDKTIRIWNWKEGTCIDTLEGHTSRIHCIRFNPDGNFLASGSSDRTIRIWNIEQSKLPIILMGHGSRVLATDFSSDSLFLASGSGDHTVKIWNWRDVECLHTLHGHTDWVHGVSFSPDGKTVASCSDDQTIKLWDIFTGDCLKTFRGHSAWVSSIDFHPSGDFIISGSGDRTIKVWNMEGECLKTIDGDANQAYSVSFSPDGKTILTGGTEVSLWNFETGQCIYTINDRPYEGMNITGVKGLTLGTIASLKALGAIENEEVRSENVE